jgi:hypothetical protein
VSRTAPSAAKVASPTPSAPAGFTVVTFLP